MLKLTRKNNEVFYNDTKLRINAQATKGPDQEVVDISKCPEANGQKWLRLAKIQEGTHEYECKQRIVVSAQKYTLTEEEQKTVSELQAQINQIIEAAKARYVHIPNTKINVDALTEDAKRNYIAQIEKYLENIKA